MIDEILVTTVKTTQNENSDNSQKENNNQTRRKLSETAVENWYIC